MSYPVAVLSDLHLPNDARDPRHRAFVRLLGELRGRGVHELWLLGDILDLFVGSFAFWREVHGELFTALRTLRESGCRVLWLEGNHDFHVGKLLGSYGLEVRDGELELEVGPARRRVLIAHGDLVNTADEAYLAWRATTRNPLFRALISLAPNALARRLLLPAAESVSRRSRTTVRDDDATIRERYRSFADRKFAEGFEGVFLGHCHVSDLYVRDRHFYLNLGSWLGGEDSMQYALWDAEAEAFPKVENCRIMEA